MRVASVSTSIRIWARKVTAQRDDDFPGSDALMAYLGGMFSGLSVGEVIEALEHALQFFERYHQVNAGKAIMLLTTIRRRLGGESHAGA